MKQKIDFNKLILSVAWIACLGLAFWGGFTGITGVSTIGTISFLALLAMANLDQIEEFKATVTGISAKTRHVIDEAQSVIGELRSLALVFAETTLTTMVRSNRWDAFSDDDQERIKDSILKTLDELAIPKADQEPVLSDWHLFAEFDYAMGILGSTVPQGVSDPSECEAEWRILREMGPTDIPASAQISEFLSKWGLLDSERTELIEDYNYYIREREHRRPEVWKQRHSWSGLAI